MAHFLHHDTHICKKKKITCRECELYSGQKKSPMSQMLSLHYRLPDPHQPALPALLTPTADLQMQGWNLCCIDESSHMVKFSVATESKAKTETKVFLSVRPSPKPRFFCCNWRFFWFVCTLNLSRACHKSCECSFNCWVTASCLNVFWQLMNQITC